MAGTRLQLRPASDGRNSAHLIGERDVAAFYSWSGGCRQAVRLSTDQLARLGQVRIEYGIRELEIAALSASMKKDHAKAIELMKKATALEEQTSAPYGPPSLIKPTHELFGEILLRAGKPAEAAEQFKIALLRQPNRARSLLGAARAAAQSGNQAAATRCLRNTHRAMETSGRQPARITRSPRLPETSRH